MDNEWVYLLRYDDEVSGMSETIGVFSTLQKVITVLEKYDISTSDITEKTLRDYDSLICEVRKPTVIDVDGQSYGFLQDHHLPYQTISIQRRRVY